MTLAKIKLDEGVKLNFGVSITGTSGVAETRFVIENKNFSVSKQALKDWKKSLRLARMTHIWKSL
jgi:hypothetical protein